MTRLGTESVVLTGCGWVTPFAAGTVDDVLSCANRDDLRPAIEIGHRVVPDQFLTESPNLTPELKRDKKTLIAAVALEYACADASLDRGSIPPHRVGMVLGCALAGQVGMMEFATEVREQSPRFVSPIHFPQTVGNYPAGALARAYGIRGPNVTIACGVASGLDAIAEACGLIASGQADVAFAGGTDTLSEVLADGLAVTGLPTSDGSCLFVIESAAHASARGARPLAAISRCAPRVSSDELKRTQVDAVRSGTCGKEAGTIVIDRWMGHCPGSLGAACVAAAIGAVHGHALPICDPKSRTGVGVSRVQVDRLPVEDGMVRGVVYADTDDTRGTTVELTIPLNR